MKNVIKRLNNKFGANEKNGGRKEKERKKYEKAKGNRKN